jgi:hypothetical protein
VPVIPSKHIKFDKFSYNQAMPTIISLGIRLPAGHQCHYCSSRTVFPYSNSAETPEFGPNVRMTICGYLKHPIRPKEK